MSAPSPCPVCGERIVMPAGRPGDFDCGQNCRRRDPAGWSDARAVQLTGEIAEHLEQIRKDRDETEQV